MTDCVFCKIVSGEIPSEKVYEDNRVIAFNDIEPQAPVHQLIIPRQHIATLNDLSQEHNELIAHMHQVARQLAFDQGLSDHGYRVVMNCNAGGGQAVYHVHLHLLGGRQMHWPPG